MAGPIGKYAPPDQTATVSGMIDAGVQASDAWDAQRAQEKEQEVAAYRDAFRAAARTAGNQTELAYYRQKWLQATSTSPDQGDTNEAAAASTNPNDYQQPQPQPQPPIGPIDATSFNGELPATSNQGENRPGTAQGSSGSGQQDVGGSVPAQYNDRELTPAEANAACGPAAAVAFARAYGRNPTLREAVDLAKKIGWTTNGGMNGVANEKVLLDKLGVSAHLEGQADWQKIAQDANTGNPVTVSTPQHYFVIDGFAAGKFHVGNSGTAVQSLGGHDWMTPQQIQSVGRGVNGVLYMDHPLADGGNNGLS